MKTDENKWGLVLAGGGGKGAYEIGVWKALRESKAVSIGAVSGTSVGALNAALYAAGDYDIAENIWLDITPDKILTVRDFSESVKAAFSTVIKSAGGPVGSILVKKYLSNYGGMFSRKGLINIIEKSGILDKINGDTIPCYATCYNMTHMRRQSFYLNIESKDRIKAILLASSAIPSVFSKEKIEGNEYYDGGIPVLGDNVPVKPLYERGYRKFIVVHLSGDNVNNFSQKFKDAKFIHVSAKEDQGGFFDGTLDFAPLNVKKRIQQGYEDMRRLIEKANFDTEELWR